MAKNKNKNKNKKSLPIKKRSYYTAKTADRHTLYQLSVQAPEYEVATLEKSYREAYAEIPLNMREDFCGTALLSAAWVKSHEARRATGVDICSATLAWGKQHNLAPLGEAQERVTLLNDDVRARSQERFDLVNALNFSYWIFKTRDDLRAYFKSVLESLEEKGLFFLDAYGGWESQQPMLEPREIAAGFTYTWDQDSFDPITHDVVNHIHFEFEDGTKLEKAFTYEWRYWSLREVQELLTEAGFSQVKVYWDESEDDEGEDYRVATRADNQPGWLAYLVALP